MDFFIPWMTDYIELAFKMGPNHNLILFGDLLISSIIVLVLFGLYFSALKEEKFVFYLGLAFSIGILLVPIQKSWRDDFWQILGHLTIPILIWITADHLIKGRQHMPGKAIKRLKEAVKKIRPETQWPRLKKLWEAWSSMLKVAPILIFALSLVGALAEESHYKAPFHRLIPAIVMSIVLLRLGYGLAVNLRSSGTKKAKFVGILFGLLGIVAALIVLLKVLHPVIAVLQAKGAISDWKNDPGVEQFPLILGLDRLTLLAFGLLKVALFVGALIIMVRSLGKVISDKNLMEDVTHQNTEVLDKESNGGLLAALGKDLNADYVELCIRLTSLERVATWMWFDNNFKLHLIDTNAFEERVPEETLNAPWFTLHQEIKSPVIQPLPTEKEAVCGYVLKHGVVVANEDESFQGMDITYQTVVPDLKTYVHVPIYYQGGVIGTFASEARTEGRFTPSATRRVKRYARLLAPMVHGRREMNALDHLGENLGRIGNARYPNRKLFESIVKEIHGTLGAVGTCIIFNMGFQRIFCGLNAKKMTTRSFGDPKEGSNLFKQIMHAENYFDLRRFATYRQILSMPLGDGELRLGFLFWVTRITDIPSEPTLVRGPLLRKSVATLAKNAIVSGVTNNLDKHLSRIRIRLSNHESKLEYWFHVIESELLKCGIKWIAASIPQKDKLQYLGISERDGKKIQKTFDSNAVGKIKAYPIKMKNKPYTLLWLRMPNKASLWLALECNSFDQELTTSNLPWWNFLEGVQETTGKALERLHVQEIENLVTRMEIDAQRSIVQNLWLHELRNGALQIAMATNLANELLTAGIYEKSKERLDKVSLYVDKFQALAKDLNKPLKLDNRTSYAFKEVLDMVRDYYRVIWAGREIECAIQHFEEFQADLPFSHLYLALSNLVANAVKVMKGGLLQIVIRGDGDRRYCIVTDTGPGIPEDRQDKIWEAGYTTENSTGIGLAGTRLLLQGGGGNITLDKGYKKGARFIIEIPVRKADKEKQQ